MTQRSDETPSSESPAAANRREFCTAIGTLGLLGAGLGSRDVAAQTRSSGPEFAKPANLKPGAQLDSRFPVSFSQCVGQGLQLVVQYFTALSQRDLPALAKTLHFPFALYEEIEPIVVASERDLLARPPATLNGTANGKSRIAKGSYDLLESVNVH